MDVADNWTDSTKKVNIFQKWLENYSASHYFHLHVILVLCFDFFQEKIMKKYNSTVFLQMYSLKLAYKGALLADFNRKRLCSICCTFGAFFFFPFQTARAIIQNRNDRKNETEGQKHRR